MSHSLYIDETPEEVKNAKVRNTFHLQSLVMYFEIDIPAVGASSHHPEYSQWPESADYVRGIS
jgi:hypothetical protein